MVPMMIASTALQAIGQISAGSQAQAAGNYNATILDQNAAEAARAGAEREGMSRERSRQALSSQRAAMLANGIDPGTGSALVGAEQQMRDAELDALQLRYEGLMQSRDLKAQAGMERWQGKAKKRQANMSAVANLMQSGAGYLSMSGFGAKGPGFSGTQMPAPVETRSIPRG